MKGGEIEREWSEGGGSEGVRVREGESVQKFAKHESAVRKNTEQRSRNNPAGKTNCGLYLLFSYYFLFGFNM